MKAREIKIELFQMCKQQVEERYSKIKQTIARIEESLFEESKNSSGDKHETGRAMLQIDRENAGKQLKEIEVLAQLLHKMDITATSDYVRLGSLVYTTNFSYFISISIGSVDLGGRKFLCVALNSPVGQLLSGKRVGDNFILNGQSFTINQVE